MAGLDRKIADMLTDCGMNWEDNKKLTFKIKELIRNSGLEEIKDSYINSDRLKKSAECPICEKHIEFQKVSLTKRFCELLIKSYHVHRKGKQYFHAGKDIGVSYSDGGGYAKLRHWGFIEPQKQPNSNKTVKGMWTITDVGVRFVEAQINLPKDVVLYNSKRISIGNIRASIRDVLGDVEYEKLMNL